MLKRLELVGFKSFAERTRLDFDPGISAIVGPNGSGKSNIVDAIRWILGEQSAKSLRGKEMADCIFNGSGTRRSLGMAEVSLTLDNTKRFLTIDADEIVLSRRVYRSGEGEYLINGQIARLRDIKDLLLGTGAGHHAYSVIEQGKVDQILQASTKDRRFIFEEAAGISRFKARKIEALRRLERVTQNLVRVQDIKDEVDKQLRSLRSQASKARRFREWSDRYRQLRLQAGHDEWRQISHRLEDLARETEPGQEQLDHARQQLAIIEPEIKSLEDEVGKLEAIQRDFDRQWATLREQTMAIESEIANDENRDRELREEADANQIQLALGRRRMHEMDGELRNIRRRHEQALAEHQQLEHDQIEHQSAVEKLQLEQKEEQARFQDLQKVHRERFIELSRLENEQSAIEGQLSLQWQQHDRVEQLVHGFIHSIDGMRREIARLHEQEIGIRGQLDESRRQAGQFESIHREVLEQRRACDALLSEEQKRRIAAESRIDVLEQLRQRHEGIDDGVKTILDQRAGGEPRWNEIIGVLADLIEVDAGMADLVELALGPRAQSLVVRSLDELNEEHLEHARQLPGRVHFLGIDDPMGDRLVVVEDTSTWPALSTFVRCEPLLRPLIDRLLGQTYLVDDFADARHGLRYSMECRYITPAGDTLDPDGSVGAGPIQKTTGLLARGAEIRRLREEVSNGQESIELRQAELRRIDAQLVGVEARLDQQDSRRSALADQARHIEILVREHQERLQSTTAQFDAALADRNRLASETGEGQKQLASVEDRLSGTHEFIRETHDQIESASAALAERSARVEEQQQSLAATRTALAVALERQASLAAEIEQRSADLEARRLEIDAWTGRRKAHRDRRRETQLRLLAQRAALAEIYRERDLAQLRIGNTPHELASARAQRQTRTLQLAEHRRSVDHHRERLHQLALETTELRLLRESVANRIAEDYQVDLANHHLAESDRLPESPEEIHQEIEDLRDKLARLGSVNSDAVDELDDLEQRSTTFELQIGDLESAKSHLEQLIGRINEECRRLFIDTFEVIRGHFQEHFRRLFGGGKADMILEDETDVLESGIDIVARPPGKEPQSISLLSGGEKTMTAVALVMAIFRSKPSPFCILDEVDAALDEANIGRFVQLLRDYTNLSQFILITHSKTTMASADVLHGITQRESGVSIRVSVRLEDVTSDGEFIDPGISDTSDSAA